MARGWRVAAAGSALALAALSAAQSPRLGLQLGRDEILKAAISRDDRLLLTGSAGAAPSARLYDIATGSLLRSFVGNTSTIDCVALSPDGRFAAAGGDDRTLRVWDTRSGDQVWVVSTKEFFGSGVLQWSPDGRFLMADMEDTSSSVDHDYELLWNAATGAEAGRAEITASRMTWQFAPDGRTVFHGSEPQAGGGGTVVQVSVPDLRTVQTWKLGRDPTAIRVAPDGRTAFAGVGSEVEELDLAGGAIKRKLAAPDGSLFLCEGRPEILTIGKANASLYDLGTQQTLATIRRPTDYFGYAASPDGKVVALCGRNAVTCFDARTGRLLCTTAGLTTPLFSIASIDDDRLVLGADGASSAIWSFKSGRADVPIHGNPMQLETVAACPQRDELVTGGFGPKLTIRSADTGEVTAELDIDSSGCLDAQFSRDGTLLAVATASPTNLNKHKTAVVALYDTTTWHAVREWAANEPSFVAFSPDSKRLAVSDSGSARVFDVSTGKEIARAGSAERAIQMLAFSPAGKLWATTKQGVVVRLDSDGKPMTELPIAKSNLGAVAFAPDGNRCAVYALYDRFALYDTANGRPVLELERPPAAVVPLVFTRDGRFLLGGLLDGTVRVWSTTTGRMVATFVTFLDGSWAVVDPKGRYDASNGGDVAGLFWIFGQTPVALSQLKRFFYDPNLLSKILGRSTEPVRAVPDLRGLALFPRVSVATDASRRLITVRLTDQGGGIGATDIALNGVVIGTHGAPAAGLGTLTFRIDTRKPSIASRLLPLSADGKSGMNVLEVTARNRSGSLKSRPESVTIPGATGGPATNLYALVVGYDFKGTNRRLHFAAQDAEAFATGLQLAASELLGRDRVHVRLLSADAGTEAPTKLHVVRAMAEIAASATPTDVVFIYLAGHGVARAAGKGGYFYLTADAGSADPESDPLADRYTLSSAELEGWLQSRVRAAKRAIVLDTCAAGAAVNDFTAPRALPRDLELAWEQLKDNAGLYVLAGCAADRYSYEATNVGHGLLTYSLLEAIDEAQPSAVGNRGFLEIDQWFRYATDRVRALEDELGMHGVQNAEERRQADARDYPVGLVDAKVAGKLDLPLPGPVLLLDTFRNADNDDPIELTDAIDGLLSNEIGAGRATYWPNVKRHPKALQLRGSYRVEGNQVRVTVRLMRFVGTDLRAETLDTFEVLGSARAKADLAKAVIAATDARIQHDWERVNGSRQQ